MRWCGIYRLFMCMTGHRPIVVDGVKNATEVRDMLAEIDAAREL